MVRSFRRKPADIADSRWPRLGVLCLLASWALSLAANAQTVLAADYGVVPDSTVNNAPALQRALDAAVWARQPGQWAVVVLPAGVIGYQGEIVANPDSLEIRGAGGTVLTRDTLADETGGTAPRLYYPVRRADAVTPGAPVTRLRVLDGAMGRPTVRGQSITRIILRAPTTKRPLGRRWHRFRLTDLVLDGNEAGNLDALRAISDKKSRLQDGVSHTGLAANGHDGYDYCEDLPDEIRQRGRVVYRRPGNRVGLLVTVERVEVTGFAATGLVGNRCTRWRLHTVRGADTAYNHVFYHTDGGGEASAFTGPLGSWGGWTHVTLAGHAWTHVVTQSGIVARNVVYEDWTPNPMRGDPTNLIGVRGGRVQVKGFASTGRPGPLWRDNGGDLVLDADAPPFEGGAGTPPDSLLVLPPPRERRR